MIESDEEDEVEPYQPGDNRMAYETTERDEAEALVMPPYSLSSESSSHTRVERRFRTSSSSAMPSLPSGLNVSPLADS